MDFNVGIDIEQISKFSKKDYAKNKRFYEKIFTENEIKYCLSKNNPYPHFTARFCAKEAVLKAVGDFNLTEIEVKFKENRPLIKYPGTKKITISLSHTDDYAIAIAIAY